MLLSYGVVFNTYDFNELRVRTMVWPSELRRCSAVRLVWASGVRFPDQDLLFCFHKYILLPMGVVKYAMLPNRVGIGTTSSLMAFSETCVHAAIDKWSAPHNWSTDMILIYIVCGIIYVHWRQAITWVEHYRQTTASILETFIWIVITYSKWSIIYSFTITKVRATVAILEHNRAASSGHEHCICDLYEVCWYYHLIWFVI